MTLTGKSLIGIAAILSVLAPGAMAQTAVTASPAAAGIAPAPGEHVEPAAKTAIDPAATSGAAVSGTNRNGPGAATAPVGDTTPSAKGGK